MPRPEPSTRPVWQEARPEPGVHDVVAHGEPNGTSALNGVGGRLRVAKPRSSPASQSGQVVAVGVRVVKPRSGPARSRGRWRQRGCGWRSPRLARPKAEQNKTRLDGRRIPSTHPSPSLVELMTAYLNPAVKLQTLQAMFAQLT
jgi:hypothetical protein